MQYAFSIAIILIGLINMPSFVMAQAQPLPSVLVPPPIPDPLPRAPILPPEADPIPPAPAAATPPNR